MLTLLGCFAVIQPGLFTWRAAKPWFLSMHSCLRCCANIAAQRGNFFLVSWLLRAGTMTSNGTANGNVDTVKAPPCEDPQRYDGVTRPYTVRAEISPTCLLCHRFLRVA